MIKTYIDLSLDVNVTRARQGLWTPTELVFCGGFPHAVRALMGVGSRLAMA